VIVLPCLAVGATIGRVARGQRDRRLRHRGAALQLSARSVGPTIRQAHQVTTRLHRMRWRIASRPRSGYFNPMSNLAPLATAVALISFLGCSDDRGRRDSVSSPDAAGGSSADGGGRTLHPPTGCIYPSTDAAQPEACDPQDAGVCSRGSSGGAFCVSGRNVCAVGCQLDTDCPFPALCDRSYDARDSSGAQHFICIDPLCSR